jgi:replication factor A1
MDIKDLRDGAKRVTVDAKVVEKGDVRDVKSRFDDNTYQIADVIIADETGSIKLTLWNDQIDMVNIGDNVKVDNGYVTSFKGEIQLNVGKFGKLDVN